MNIAIVMAVYNGEKYLVEQLDSLLCQTYNEFELYAYDDGSSDASVSILQSYAGKDARVHYRLNDTNKGYSRNFIDAIMESNADIIFLSDQDDIWHPQKLEIMLTVMEKNPEIGLLISDDESSFDSFKDKTIYSFYTPRKIPPEEFLKRGAYRGMNIALSKKFIQNLMKDDDFVKSCHSHDWMLELIASKLECMFKIDVVLAFHRQHESNTANLGNDNTNKYTLRVSSTKKKIDIYDWAIKNIHQKEIVKLAGINLNHHKTRFNLLTVSGVERFYIFTILLVDAFRYKFPKKRIFGDLIYSLRKH